MIWKFNPNADEKVEKIKSLCKELINIVSDTKDEHPIRKEVIEWARLQILIAQMLAVKSLHV